MIAIPTIEEAWQDEPQTYEKKRAIRELTANCPCDVCELAPVCTLECKPFKRWVQTGDSAKDK